MAVSKKAAQQYNDQSIKSLKGADRVRKRPSVIFGSDGLEGCEHSFFEILSNSVDEAREGYGNVIRVTVYQDLSIEVDDRGRGVPLGWNESEGRWNWDLIYCELYAGGKYDNNEEGAYEYSLGLNGLGACATQYASEYMTVKSFDGTVERSIRFRRGEVSGELVERPLSPKEKRTGTVVLWRPDIKVFTDIQIPHSFFRDVLYRQAVVNAGVTFVLRLEQEDESFTEEKFLYEKGIDDYLAERVGDSNALTARTLWHLETKGRDRPDLEEYRFKADVTFCVSNKVSMQEYYHNSSFLEDGGSPDRAVKSAFLGAMDKYIKANNLYNKGEDGITFTDIADCLVLVINSFSTKTSYVNQTKKAINNAFIAKALTEFLRQNLEVYFTENPKAADLFAKQVLINKRSRESAERARVNVTKALSGPIDGVNRVEKFVNCRSKDPSVAELYIVEGDSALSSCKLGRDAEFQAVIPVRGKTLNCLKSDYDKIFKNEIITDLLKVIGCGVEMTGKRAKTQNTFDLKKLRWSKIIICTDADEDGFQIRTLLLTIFYRLLPTLLAEHKVFIAESPLFEITVKGAKEETYFAYDEFEKAEILEKLGSKKYTLQRSKGLGENNPDMMWQTTMNPETRRLISVSPADAAQTEIIFDTLLGENLPARKKFIVENGSRYMKDIDV